MPGLVPDPERTTPASPNEGERRILQPRATPPGDWAENPMPAAAGGWAIGGQTGRLSPRIGWFASQLPVARG